MYITFIKLIKMELRNDEWRWQYIKRNLIYLSKSAKGKWALLQEHDDLGPTTEVGDTSKDGVRWWSRTHRQKDTKGDAENYGQEENNKAPTCVVFSSVQLFMGEWLFVVVAFSCVLFAFALIGTWDLLLVLKSRCQPQAFIVTKATW